MSVTLAAQDLKFNPAVVTAKAGDKVTVTINNRDGFEHNFSIAELNVSQDIEKGASKSVTFTATGTSNLQFFCKYHKAKGMVGTLDLGGTNAAPAPAASSASSDKPYGSGY